MPEIAASSAQMWFVFVLILTALALFTQEQVPMEVTAIGVICTLLIFFHFFPVLGPDGVNRLGPIPILRGFANTALVSVAALLVIGHGMARTGVLDRGARLMLDNLGGRSWVSIAIILFTALAVSAFLNNIPVVVIFVPVLQAVASRFDIAPSKLLIPLSFASVLGGMTTLIGSSTNLLVNGALVQAGHKPFTFFEFSVPGIILAGAGFAYVFFIAPHLLPERKSFADDVFEGKGKQFIAQIVVTPDSELVGASAIGGHFSGLPEDMTAHVVVRGGDRILPPFEEFVARPGDVIVVAATRQALANTLAEDAEEVVPESKDGSQKSQPSKEPWRDGERVLAEVTVIPGSAYVNRTLRQIGFRRRNHCVVLGIKRRARMLRDHVREIPLREGDELLVMGQPEDIEALQNNHDHPDSRFA